MNKNKLDSIRKKANEIRKDTITAIGKLGVGHIGGALSICEVLAVLYYDAMNVDSTEPKKQDRDRLVLSKGHGGPALYATLSGKGYFGEDWKEMLNRPNTSFPSHCDMIKTPGIDMSTGSLGQGFSAAMGMAIAAKIDKNPCYIYTIIGDGESQEGQIWEAAMLAGSRGLDNVIAFTDYNKFQIDGTIEQINGLYPLDKKWEAFGWHVQTVDGHDIEAISSAIMKAKSINSLPSMIILDTIKGKGAAFCENLRTSHNMQVSEEMWKNAVRELEVLEESGDI